MLKNKMFGPMLRSFSNCRKDCKEESCIIKGKCPFLQCGFEERACVCSLCPICCYIDLNGCCFLPCFFEFSDKIYDKRGLDNLSHLNNKREMDECCQNYRDRKETVGCTWGIPYAYWVEKGNVSLKGRSSEYNSFLKKNYKISQYKSCVCFIPCKSVDLQDYRHLVETYNRGYGKFNIDSSIKNSQLYDDHVPDIISDYLFGPQPEVIV